jgi:hypothetical protein
MTVPFIFYFFLFLYAVLYGKYAEIRGYLDKIIYFLIRKASDPVYSVDGEKGAKIKIFFLSGLSVSTV